MKHARSLEVCFPRHIDICLARASEETSVTSFRYEEKSVPKVISRFRAMTAVVVAQGEGGRRLTPDVISRDSCYDDNQEELSFSFEISLVYDSIIYDTEKRLTCRFTAWPRGFSSSSLVRFPSFLRPRPQISCFGKELLYRPLAFRKRKLESTMAATSPCLFTMDK